MKYKVVCDDSNNTYAQELQDEVVADLHVEGVSQFIHIVFKAVPPTTWEQLRHNLFTDLETLLRRYPDQEIIDEFYRLAVKHSGGYGKKRR